MARALSSTQTWNEGKSRSRVHLSVLTGRVLACSDSYRAAWPTLKRKKMDYDSFTVLKFPTLGQPWRCERSSKVAWYIHTNPRLWPLLLRSLFMNIIISSCKIRATCPMSSSICVETKITGSVADFIIPKCSFCNRFAFLNDTQCYSAVLESKSLTHWILMLMRSWRAVRLLQKGGRKKNIYMQPW